MIKGSYNYPQELRGTFIQILTSPEEFCMEFMSGRIRIGALAFMGGNFAFAAAMLGLEFLVINTSFQSAQTLQLLTYAYVFYHGVILTAVAVLVSWNPKGTLKAFRLYLYVWGLFVVFTLLTEMLKVVSVLPFSFGSTPLCQPRTTECMVQNYGWIPPGPLSFTSGYLTEMLTAFSYIYLYVAFRASLGLKAAKFMLVLGIVSLLGQFDQFPFIRLEDYLHTIGRL